MAEVSSIDTVNKVVKTTDMGDRAYDHLVIATGCTTNFFGNNELAQHAMPMKEMSDAIAIRNRILIDLEKFKTATEEEKKELLNIVIVGAGPTGVELAGAFAELKNDILHKDYPKIDFTGLKVILLEGSDYTLVNMSDQSRMFSRKYLEELGVEVKTGVILTSYDGTKATLNNGEEILCKNLIWSAGVTGNVINGVSEKDKFVRNRYIVNRYNQVSDFENIYVLGDVAYMETPLFPKGHPQVANVAINQAKNLANNIIKSLKGKQNQLKEYEYKDLGTMATIGKNKAVVDLKHWKFQGAFAWITWMFLHLMLILTVRNKLIIFINWAWAYFTKDTSLRLIIKPKIIDDTGSSKNEKIDA